DGTVYRRIATATLDLPKTRSVTFEVKVSGKPLAFLAECPALKSAEAPLLSVDEPALRSFSIAGSLFMACRGDRPYDLRLPRGTRQARYTLSLPEAFKAPGTWRIGVYEWTPPAVMRPAPAPVR